MTCTVQCLRDLMKRIKNLIKESHVQEKTKEELRLDALMRAFDKAVNDLVAKAKRHV